MSGLELNKVAASILLAALIAMVTGKIADVLYIPKLNVAHKGYVVDVASSEATNASADDTNQPPVDIKQLLASADAGSGETVFKKCSVCHTVEKGAPNKVGPNLYGVINSKKGEGKGYNFSNAMKNAGGTWTYEDLFKYLQKPQAYVPGTKMSFAGINDPKKIADLIKYINSFSDSPQPLP
jgi:cytochrome c